MPFPLEKAFFLMLKKANSQQKTHIFNNSKTI